MLFNLRKTPDETCWLSGLIDTGEPTAEKGHLRSHDLIARRSHEKTPPRLVFGTPGEDLRVIGLPAGKAALNAASAPL